MARQFWSEKEQPCTSPGCLLGFVADEAPKDCVNSSPCREWAEAYCEFQASNSEYRIETLIGQLKADFPPHSSSRNAAQCFIISRGQQIIGKIEVKKIRSWKLG